MIRRARKIKIRWRCASRLCSVLTWAVLPRCTSLILPLSTALRVLSGKACRELLRGDVSGSVYGRTRAEYLAHASLSAYRKRAGHFSHASLSTFARHCVQYRHSPEPRSSAVVCILYTCLYFFVLCVRAVNIMLL